MYEDYYKFTAKPFRLTPDPRFLFKSNGHSRALAYLRYGLHCGEGFIVVTGEVGTGKTTLMRSLMETIKSEPITAAQITTTQIDSHDLLRLIASAFKLPSGGNLPKAELLRGIEEFLLARARSKQRVLLVIDEAQNLPIESLEELRMLSNIQVGDQAILQSFLLGQSEFRDTLLSDSLEQFRQRVLASYHLGAMSLEETRSYIGHRLGLVGWDGAPRIEDETYSRIHEFTGGIPRRINTLCDRLFLYGSLEELQVFGLAVIDAVIKENLEESAGARSRDQSQSAATQNIEHGSSGARTQLHLADNTVSDANRRLLSLERRVTELEFLNKADRERLAKFVMMALLSDTDIDIEKLLAASRRHGMPLKK